LAFHSGREADHSPPSSAKVKEWVELYLHSPNTSSLLGARLGEHRDNFTPYLYLYKLTMTPIQSICYFTGMLKQISRFSHLEYTFLQIGFSGSEYFSAQFLVCLPHRCWPVYLVP
jgi:hypothetical protein